MKFKLDTAQLFVPDGLPAEQALTRTTHLAIGAHQDDLEIMAVDGILQCFQQGDKWFSGVVVTDGRGSPRSGLYGDYTDEEMHEVRIKEQKKAAVIGEYAAQVFLDYPSSAIKDVANTNPTQDIIQLSELARPDVVYTHNLADKHDTHVGVALRVIGALRELPATMRPRQLYGCEVWRDLDWMLDTDKVAFNCSAHDNLQTALMGVFDSQVSGGKRYDRATMGRRRAHATYHAAHATDVATGLVFAMDLTPLIEDPIRDIASFVQDLINHFRLDVVDRLRRMM